MVANDRYCISTINYISIRRLKRWTQWSEGIYTLNKDIHRRGQNIFIYIQEQIAKEADRWVSSLQLHYLLLMMIENPSHLQL